MSFYAIYPAIAGGGGSGGVTSINGDTTAAQVIAAGTGISVSSVGGTTTITNTGGGSGTVTSVSVTTANGVSGTVATATTTPAISLTLGAITPSSVAASGAVTGSNLSGTNTGDQTITLTSDVTGSGTGSFAATIAANAVTNAKLAQMPAHTIKGNNTAGTANALDLTQTQVTAELNQFTTTLQGVVPGSGGGSTNFLRADGTWAVPVDTGITQLTGDVTAGPGSGSQAATIANLAVTNAKIANATIDLTTKVTGALPIANGGTGQTTANPAFNALSPLTTKGDLLSFSTVNARLPVGTDGQVVTADSGQALGVKWATIASSTNGNVRAPEGGGTVTLTNADNRTQRFDLTAAETVLLPTTGVLKGDIWEMINPNGFQLMIEASDASLILNSWGSCAIVIALTNTPVASTDWAVITHTVLLGRTWVDYTPTFSTGTGVSTIYVAKWQRVAIETVSVYFQVLFSGTNVGGSGPLTIFGPSGFTYSTGAYPDGSIIPLGNAIDFNSVGPTTFFGNIGPAYEVGNNSSSFLFWLTAGASVLTGAQIVNPPWNGPSSTDHMSGTFQFKASELSET